MIEEFINYNAAIAPEESDKLFKAIDSDMETLISLIKKNLPKLDVKLTEEKIAELLPRYENNKSLDKCYGTVDRDFAETLLRRLFVER